MGSILMAADSPMWLWGALSTLYYFAQVIVGLGFVIFVHELGHFLVAKACGVKCEKFYVGFDVPISIGPLRLPATLWKQQWGETEYGIGVIPLGGYVKMLGQDDNPANAEAEAERIRVGQPDAPKDADAGAANAGAAASTTPTEQLDPRSYPAKSVPQRMAIISAGVIMNVIFAAIFAMIAYGLGVEFTPTVVGGTSPGSPAWAAGLSIDSRIVRIGKNGPIDEHLRFGKDLMPMVIVAGADGADVDLLLQYPDGSQREVAVRPRRSDPSDRRHTIGVMPPGSTQVVDIEALRHLPAFRAQPPFQSYDEIVAVDGEPIESFRELQAALAATPERELQVTVERYTTASDGKPDKQAPRTRVDIVTPPAPMRYLGLGMKVGPIVEFGVRSDSPAARAGLKVGDRLVELNGQPVGDAMTLPFRLQQLAGQPITLTVVREGARVEVQATPETPQFYDRATISSTMSAEALGVAYDVECEVVEVVPGSPADEAGLQVGDVVERAVFIPAGPEQKKIEMRQFATPGNIFRSAQYLEEFLAGDKGLTWTAVHSRLQRGLPDTRVKLYYQRAGKILEAELSPTELAGVYETDRAFFFVSPTEIRRAASVGEAFGLGVRETKEQIGQVLTVLRLLVSNKLSITNLGGPIMIISQASSEASMGFSQLLLFLAFLSCNLAVLNFLPIPVLDGGHMVFLAAELVRGKPLNEQLVMKLTLVGLSLLLCLMLFVFVLDIGRVTGLSQ